ncbi:MAG: nitric-oxide reductase large subunit, partial [Deltaproteobacteria bacterium]|nr:nitric-oxide reductase large subunit [Deltaproteobacteria bacterium]
AFAVAGVSQVYLERKAGMDFMAVQESMEIHFFGLIMAACLLSFGIGLYIWNFIQYGLPNDEAVEAGNA